MKQVYTLVVMLFTLNSFAQNIQTHYDLGKGRSYFTTTVESFKPDKLGNTFLFIDIDYNAEDVAVSGPSMAYFEFARVFKTDKMPIGIQLEYNGGFGSYMFNDTYYSYSINSAFLAGVDYSWNSSDFSKGFSLKALYKLISDKHNFAYQITGVWYYHLFDKKVTFTGFADFWREDSDFNFDGIADAKFTFLAEPQLWYNFNKNIALGGEIELSSNFANQEGFKVCPTLGFKYTL